MERNATQIEDSFCAKAVSALRNGFGGHEYVGLDGQNHTSAEEK